MSKTMYLFPPGGGGNFISGLLENSCIVKLEHNEYKNLDSAVVCNYAIRNNSLKNIIDSNKILKTHSRWVWEETYKYDNSINCVVISSRSETVAKYISLLGFLKSYFNVASFIESYKNDNNYTDVLIHPNNHQYNLYKFDMFFIDREPNRRFMIDDSIISKMYKAKKFINKYPELNLSLTSRLLLSYYSDRSDKSIQEFAQMLVESHVESNIEWNNELNTLEGKDNTKVLYYEDIILASNDPIVQQYHNDNIASIKRIDNILKTNLSMYCNVNSSSKIIPKR